MKLKVNKHPLVEAVSQVNLAVAANTTNPILTGIKLEADVTSCTLTASDSDISVRAEIQQDADEGKDQLHIEQNGSVVLPSRFFVDIIRKMPDQTVEIEVKDAYTTTIRSGQTEFQLNGMDPDEFPRLPYLREDHVLSLPSNLLKTLIRQTSFSVSTKETRPVLTGVLWQLNEGRLQFIATDSHRLARREAQVETSEDQAFNHVVVPGKSLSDLNKILADDDRLVDIVVTDNQILIKVDNTSFYSRLLEGKYPDTSRIIPQSSKVAMTVQTKDFLNAIDRAALLTRTKENNVVKLVTEGQMVEITANSPEVGKVSEKVSVKEIDGDDMKISFNAKYMIDALRALDSEQVKISFSGAMSPFTIQPTDHEWTLYLVLPVRTY